MKILFVVFCVAGASGAASLAADINPPRTEFESLHCERLLDSSNFARSDQFREDLQIKIERRKRMFEVLRKTLTLHFFNTMDARTNRVSAAAEVMKRFGVGAVDSEPPPPMSAETRKAIISTYSDEPYKGIDDWYVRFEIKSKLLAVAKKAVHEDPYFCWLKLHAVDQRERRSEFGTDQSPALSPFPGPDDPESLLFANLEVSGPAYLAPEPSIVRIYRDLDPELTPEHLKHAQTILNLYWGQRVLHLEFTEPFVARSGIVWDFAPSLEDAVKNLRKISRQVRRRSAANFSKRSFERAKVQFRKISLVQIAAFRGVSLAEQEGRPPAAADAIETAKLRARLGVNSSFNTAELAGLMKLANESNTYEEFLLSAFADVGDESVILETLRELKRIVNVAQVVDDDHELMPFLLARLKQKRK